ncbi:hypothetical protein RJT34_25854 [Clitoria ternatea]|uniref:Uncharacterized protein n=1 Tax=Clitoria ternatea TaxID=43366 RepID=A0AAN9FQP6_CLITE
MSSIHAAFMRASIEVGHFEVSFLSRQSQNVHSRMGPLVHNLLWGYPEDMESSNASVAIITIYYFDCDSVVLEFPNYFIKWLLATASHGHVEGKVYK